MSLLPAINLSPLSTTLAITKNPRQGLIAGVVDTGELIAGVNNTGEQLIAGVNITGEQLIASVNDTSDKHSFANISANFSSQFETTPKGILMGLSTIRSIGSVNHSAIEVLPP